MINIGSRREVFFDNLLIDEEKTTAELRVNKLIRREVAMELNEPWEGSYCGYPNVFYAEGKWRLYYGCAGKDSPGRGGIAYAESIDGIHWVRPNLGIVEFNGSTENNLICDGRILLDEWKCIKLNDAYVFYDENPDCPKDEKYKMIMSDGNKGLASLLSEDGLHFKFCQVITRDGAFDSQNIALWDKEKRKYLCYYRGKHKPMPEVTFDELSFDQPIANALFDSETMSHRLPESFDEAYMRDVRVIESTDFRNWTKNKLITMKNDKVQLYTNGVSVYPRAPHLFVSFPTRYNERKAWTPNYDELCGKEIRLHRIKKDIAREGLALTDGIFMCSRNGYDFTRYDEAILPPPPENINSWVYGDGYNALGLIETPSDIPGADNEYSLLVIENYRASEGGVLLVRYTSRLDGFVSRHAGEEEKTLVTKEFTYNGEDLFVNIASSAKGCAYFTLKHGAESYVSYETFGNSTDKRVHFLDEDAVRKLSGKPVTLEIKMLDCDLYALRFGKS